LRPLSAADAISPAWDHTRRLLFTGRNWRTLLKIGFIACMAEAGGYNSSYNNLGSHMPSKSSAIVAALLAAAVLFSIVALVIAFAFFYLSSRLQFVLFDVVLRSDTTIAPIWRRYGGITWRWMLLKFLFWLAALACLAPMVVPFILRFIHSAAMQPSGEIANPGPFFMSILGFVFLIVLFVIVITICYVLLRDFGLPSMALENAPLSVTVHRVLRLIRMEPGQIALYILLLVILRIAGSIVCSIILVFAILIAMVPLGGGGLILWLALRHAGPVGQFAMYAGLAVLGLLLIAAVILASIVLFGYMYTFFQAYTLYFLGGRYPMLGAYLQPPAPEWTPPPAPVFPSPGDGGIVSPPPDPVAS
jgi:uncharacterized membrane protein YhaH (DUF805 family)